MGETQEPHIPTPGDLVVIEAVQDRGRQELVGTLVRAAAGCRIDSACGWIAFFWYPANTMCGAYCRVRPATVLDVECPFTERSAARSAGGFQACKGRPGHECGDTQGAGPINFTGDGYSVHDARRDAFLALTKQDSGRDHARTEPVGSDGRAPETFTGNPAQGPVGHDGAIDSGHVRGDSGTGRAAGAEGRKDPLLSGQPDSTKPAAPSGFPKCPGLVDVGGKACGAEAMGASQLCGDCRGSLDSAHNDRRRRAIGLLRRELDRPVPAKHEWDPPYFVGGA